MSDSNSRNEEFVVNWSPKKIWAYAIFCWIFSFIVMFLPSLLLIWLAASDIAKTQSILIPAFVMLVTFTLFVWMPFIFLKRRREPLAVLNRTGYTGLGKWFRPKHQDWQSDTRLMHYSGIVLINPDPFQSKASELFWGPKDGVRVSHRFAKQNRHEIEAAIKRLNPDS